MVHVVDADFVQERRGDGRALIVSVLPEEQFRAKRIPGSVNAPVDAPGFEERIRELAPDLDQSIIVHCSGASCPASAKAARLLEAMGYQAVHHFKDGLEGWAQAGQDFESGGPEEGRRPERPERGERPKRASTGLPLTGSNRP
jgi:rhodanese-related sulfurtransferase